MVMREEHNVRNWADHDPTDADAVEQAELTMDQARRTAELPILAGPLALMPDAHPGRGSTIGSVIPTKNAIIPAAVGVDIGCGMAASETSLTEDQLPDSLSGYMSLVQEAIPAGVGKGHESHVPQAADTWMRRNPHVLNQKQAGAAQRQLGTLGSGNHFFEVCVDEYRKVWLVLHSGSRGVGNQLAMQHIKVARDMGKALQYADPDLMHFTQGTEEFNAYISDMLWAQDYALQNREIMMDRAMSRFLTWVDPTKVLLPRVERRINCHHNYAQEEVWEGESIWITRKGAIQASDGLLGVIPGSMGTRSYIVSGLGNPLSYNSSSHGAGRRMSRTKARKMYTEDDLRKSMEGVGSWLHDSAKSLIDEIPESYKDIDAVMANQTDLVRVERTLHQILNFKGE